MGEQNALYLPPPQIPERSLDMSQMQGREPEDLAAERLKQIIIDVVHGQCDEGIFGKMLPKGWEETLKGDTYYESMTKS